MGWQIYALTKSALYLGLIGLSEALPAIAVALYAGHVADVVERSLILKIVISIMFLCMVLLGVCSFGIGDPHVLVPIIFVLNAISGLARGFYGPSVFGLVSDIVPRELYPNASAWNSAVWQASAVAGPILGGLLYVSLSATKHLLRCCNFAIRFVGLFLSAKD